MQNRPVAPSLVPLPHVFVAALMVVGSWWVSGIDAHAADAGSSQVAGPLDVAKSLSSAFSSVFEKVSPAVVILEVDRGPGESQALDDQMRRRFNFFFRTPQGLVPEERELDPVEGSGMIIRNDGFILTNFHVVEDAKPNGITVRLKDGRKLNGKVVGVDEATDLAVVKVDAMNLPVVVLGNSDATRVGEFAIAIGAPFSLAYSFTSGVISGKGRNDLTQEGEFEDYIQTDASINPGNSGGPLCNLDGEVIGINTLINGFNRGLGFAIPSNFAREVSDQLISKGRVSRSWLGIEIQSLADVLQRQAGAATLFAGVERGVIVASIRDGSPASASDLQERDVITMVDGVAVATAPELQKQIIAKKVGSAVDLGVWRRGRLMQVSVKTGERPVSPRNAAVSGKIDPSTPPEPPAGKHPYGVQFQNITPELAQQLGLKMMAGVVVTEVEERSAAELAGLRPGDVITRVGDRSVLTVEDIMDALDVTDRSGGVVFLIDRGGQKTYALFK